MDTNTPQLNQLKDVHLPHAVSIFPLSNTWYILIVIFIVVIILLSWWIFVKNKYKKQKLQAYAILAKIQETNSQEMLSEVSILIKRVAILKYPEVHVHTLFGEKWLEFLDKTGKTNNFTKGSGRLLFNIYQKSNIENSDKFFAVVKQWLEKVL